MSTSLRSFATLAALAAFSSTANAEGKGLFGKYNIGVTYVATTSYAQISYDSDSPPDLPEKCTPKDGEPGRIRCTAYLAPDTDENPTPGFFLETPFKRKGFLYYDAGFMFSTVSYKGGLVSKPTGPAESGQNGGDPRRRKGKIQGAPEQPLTKAYLELYGINWQSYLRFGLTPRYIPDLIFSLGFGLQTVGGRVKMLGADETRWVAQPDLFGEGELVILRAGTGALSLFVAQDQSLLTKEGTKLIDDQKALTNFRLELITAASGIRLLFPF